MNDLKIIQFYPFTDIGLKRKRNEDAFAVYDAKSLSLPRSRPVLLFSVADGIGGHSCGDRASSMACRELALLFDGSSGEEEPRGLARRLEDMIFTIDRRIRQAGEDDAACEHMGTTFSVLAIEGNVAVTAHVGDSRIYRLHGGRLTLLTTDHTFVQEMVEDGTLSPEDASTHPLRHMLTRAVGTQEPLEAVETRTLYIDTGDRFLLCSDGLHGMVADTEIKKVLTDQLEPESAGRTLLRKALKAGGSDNVTGIVIYT
ncbi:MAG: PP2C family protein-serine/threonine phosphatase [Desulforhopalus sp.]